MLEHKQIYIMCPWNNTIVGIDEDIVELIQELWRLNMRTTTCCQDASRGRKGDCKDVWIDFELDSFPAFADVVPNTVGVEWHIMPRDRRTTSKREPVKYRKVIGVTFPSNFYDVVLDYFKNRRG